MSALRALALGLALLAAAAARAAGSSAPLALTPCELEHPLHLALASAECGVLEVPENPHRPAGRKIGLHVAVVRAITSASAHDPLVILAGGPGEAASTFYVSVAAAFAPLRRERDIVLLDQRGTGASNALNCPDEEDETLAQASEAQITERTRRCLEELSAHADVAFYTTSLAVEDLERVRAALGYARINLYGASYGTRVAQQYLRRFPARVRSVILDGVVPVEAALGPRVALDAERALDDILARCAAQHGCRAAFGDPAADYRAVRASLAAHAAPVSVPDPASGARVSFQFGAAHLASALRLMSYTAEYAALLPLLLHGAAHQDYAPLASQYLLSARAYGQLIATGMHNSVVCAEDVPYWDAASIDRARLADTYLGTATLDGLKSVCRLWPRGPADADLHAPLSSDVPALLLSGSADPATPPEFARAAARGFRHVLALELQGFGHGQLTAPCIDRVMAEFVARAAVTGLDTACVRSDVPLAFFTSLNGPPP